MPPNKIQNEYMNKNFLPKKILFILITFLVVFYYWNIQKNNNVPEKNPQYGRLGNYSYLSISEIKKNYNSGIYNVEAFVVKKYNCPTCPKDAICKPCMKKNIVISETSELLKNYKLSEKEMILFVDTPEKFQLGKKYSFTIKFLESRSTEEPLNDIQAIKYYDILLE